MIFYRRGWASAIHLLLNISLGAQGQARSLFWTQRKEHKTRCLVYLGAFFCTGFATLHAEKRRNPDYDGSIPHAGPPRSFCPTGLTRFESMVRGCFSDLCLRLSVSPSYCSRPTDCFTVVLPDCAVSIAPVDPATYAGGWKKHRPISTRGTRFGVFAGSLNILVIPWLHPMSSLGYSRSSRSLVGSWLF